MLSRTSMADEPRLQGLRAPFAWTVGVGIVVLAALAVVELAPDERSDAVSTTTVTAASRSSTAGGITFGTVGVPETQDPPDLASAPAERPPAPEPDASPAAVAVAESDAGTGELVASAPDAVVGALDQPEPSQDENVAGGAVATADAGDEPSAEIGAGPFLTTPPPWAASNWTSDPNAGDGPFTTDWPSPGGAEFLVVLPPIVIVPPPAPPRR
jgi:hypothetical protein